MPQIVNTIQAILIFQIARLVKIIVPNGTEKLNSKLRKLEVCAKISDGSLLRSMLLIFGLTFPERYMIKKTAKIVRKTGSWRRFMKPIRAMVKVAQKAILLTDSLLK